MNNDRVEFEFNVYPDATDDSPTVDMSLKFFNGCEDFSILNICQEDVETFYQIVSAVRNLTNAKTDNGSTFIITICEER